MSRKMNHLNKYSGLMIAVLILSSCAKNYTAQKPPTFVFIPRYADFTYKIDGEVEVKHSYLFGAGAKKCRYVGKLGKSFMENGQAIYPYESPVMDNFFSQNGHIYQGGANSDRKILGYPDVSKLGGDIDPKTGEQEIIVTKLRSFDPLCSSRIGSSEYTLYLQKSSSQSIEQDIAQKQRLLGGAWKKFASWGPEVVVQRGKNRWTVFKKLNRADYLSDAAEYWYLPLGDGSYYYKVVFTYKSAMEEANDPEYLKARSIFDHLIDSFEVRKLTTEESAAIVNPEPIEVPQNQKFDIKKVR